MDILILAFLIVLNGIFAMSEIAVVSARKSRLASLAEDGSLSAQTALRLTNDPTPFLSTVQIGITCIGVMNGIFGEALLAAPLALWLGSLGTPAAYAPPVATAIVVITITYLTIVVGELVPKRIGQLRPERIACLIAVPMSGLARATQPFVWCLSVSTRALLRLLPMRLMADERVTEEDIHAVLDEGSSSGVIERDEHAMVKNVLRLDDRPISSLMTPRGDIVALDADLPLEDNLQRMLSAPHTLFPLWDRDSDSPLGIVDSKGLLQALIQGTKIDLRQAAVPCHFVLETLSALELLNYFKSKDTDFVFVIDEYGDVQGLVTMHDMFEALAGEFHSAEDDPWVVTRDDGSYLVDGLLPIMDVKDLLGIKSLPDEDSYETLNGLILRVLDRLPKTGEKIVLQGWLLEIVDMDGHRVDKVLISKGRDKDLMTSYMSDSNAEHS